MPETPADLWDALTAFDGDSQAALFAHCASLAVNVVKEPWNRRPGALAHGDQLARAVNLDMAAAGWRPTVDNYLGRVPKVRILEAVREAKGEQSAQLIDHLKKADMAKEAERLLEGTGWLPEPLRLADAESGTQANRRGRDRGACRPSSPARTRRDQTPTSRNPTPSRRNDRTSGAASVAPLLLPNPTHQPGLLSMSRGAGLCRIQEPAMTELLSIAPTSRGACA